MNSKPQKLDFLNRLPPRRIFLLDAIGAFITSATHGLLLPAFEEEIGLQAETLYLLSAIALVYAIYSTVNYVAGFKNWRFCLRIIAAANFLFSLLTWYIIYSNLARLTKLGITYFLIESIVIIIIAALEFRYTVKKVDT